MSAALHLDERTVMRDGALLSRLLETFVMAQLRPESEYSQLRPRLHHLRDKAGRHEIDLIAEVSGSDILGLEIKATASPSRGDARHLVLVWLRDNLGDRFVAGAVLHAGPRPFRLEAGILALPLASFWT